MDVWTTRIIILTLGLLLLVGIGGAIALDMEGRPIPPILASVVGTALGALTGYLMPYGKTTRSNDDGKPK